MTAYYAPGQFASVTKPGMAWAVYSYETIPSTLVPGSECKKYSDANRRAQELNERKP